MRIDVKECARLLLEQDDILILTHAHPDGDTLGCGFALCRALLQKGKFAYVKNEADIPPKYNYLFDDIVPMKFTPRFVVAVDVATEGLLGAIQGKYHIDLCIDHHGTNTDYADRLLLDDGAAAASEIIYKVIREMGVPLDKGMANCLYTGISTDTGCFRYASATAESYRIAADLIEAGADNGRINRVMFETKTKTYARLERLALESMRFYLDERVAIITVTQEMYHLTGSNEQETEGLAPLTRQIEGVEVGITIREKPDGTCKASLRTFESVNAAEIAKAFGGGGHPQAAACNLDMDVKTARAKLVITRERKAGHTGTLDPMATGVLPVLLGGATRFLDYLPDSNKRYLATFRLGETTDTQDCTGTVLTRRPVTADRAAVEAALSAFRGEIMQVPPMYSAVSVDGQRLYELARQGKTVERAARPVTILDLRLTAAEEEKNTYTIDVTCTKGTYIRTLIHDLGQALGCGAVMTALQRTCAMGLALADCVTLEQLQALRNSGGDFAPCLRPVDELLAAYPALQVTAPQARRFGNGGALDAVRLHRQLTEPYYRVYDPAGVFLGLGSPSADGSQLLVDRVMVMR